MRSIKPATGPFAVTILLFAFRFFATPVPAQEAVIGATGAVGLGGTSWQLVRFQGGDDTVLTPEDGDEYTIAFAADGGVSVRIDCNRGRGTWKSTAANQIEFGPLALTRAMCPPGSLHDRIVQHWGYIRSYTIKDGRLFLTLTADGGSYEFEPVRPKDAVEAQETP